MNGRCQTCDVEASCGYPYKPCDCCNYRKFKPLAAQPQIPQAVHATCAGAAEAKPQDEPASSDEALLRQALQALERAHEVVCWYSQRREDLDATIDAAMSAQGKPQP